MGFYIRKTVSVGPFRFNLSKSGVGVSVGVRGLRLGMGPQGSYVAMGKGGLYYKSSLGGRRTASRRAAPAREAPKPKVEPQPQTDSRMAIEGGNVLQMSPMVGPDVDEQINEATGSMKWWPIMLAITLVGSLLIWIQLKSDAIAIALLTLGCVLTAFIAYKDFLRGKVVLMYDLSDEQATQYQRLVDAFDQLRAQRIWNVGAFTDAEGKGHAVGENRSVERQPVEFTHGVPKALRTNIDVPAIIGGRQNLYLLPDVVLIVEGDHAGALDYEQLSITWRTTEFAEEESLASDAKVVGRTWKYATKTGEQDRRFGNNYQIQKVAYQELVLEGPAGLHKQLLFSRILDHTAFDAAIDEQKTLIARLRVAGARSDASDEGATA